MPNLLAGLFLSFMGVAAACSFFHHRCSVIPLEAEQKANTPTNIKTTNAIHIANHEVRHKTGNSRTVVNIAAMIAIMHITAVKGIPFCNTWRSFKQSTPIRVLDWDSCVAGIWNAAAFAKLG